MLLYEATDLRKYYGDHLALSLDSFRLEAGEALALTGPNGSGKSTLLRILAFLEEPSSGTLRFYASSSNPRKAVTLLLQEPYLLKESVFYNVTLGLRLRHDTKNMKNAYIAAMRAAGFDAPGDYSKRRPWQLSGGEKQRVALASRIILNTPVLLLDEPTSNVDAASSRIIIDALAKFSREGGSVICSTHDPDLAHAIGAKSVSLHRTDRQLQ